MKIRPKRLNQAGFDHVMVVAVFVVLFALAGTWLLIHSLAATNNVYLHMGSSNGPCIAGTTIQRCDGSPAQTFGKLQGSNFQIKNGSSQCLDDWNGKMGTDSKNRAYIHVTSCYSNDKNQQWNWNGGELVSAASHGCINALGNSSSPGTVLIVYTCNGQGNEIWKETPASSSGGGNNGGGGQCGSSNGSAVLAQALRFCGFSYEAGGHEATGSLWKAACPTPSNSNSGCHVDCSGLVNAATYLATGKWYDWTVDGNGYMDLNGSVDSTHWKTVSLSNAQPGDLVMASGHVEMVQSGSGSWANIRTFGAHGHGTPDGNQNTANYLNPIRLLRYYP